jgi:hypothetical protein
MKYITQEQVDAYRRDGFIILDDILSPSEVDTLIREVNIDDPKAGSAFGDAGKRKARLSFWGDTTSTIWGAASTLPNIINNIRILMNEDVGFFHGKVTLKEARTGGAWEWHQDYGYWYDQGFVFPRMMSVSVSLDENTLENGCMQVYKGSHKLGRLTHTRIENQAGADPARLEQIAQHFEKVPAVMKPGAGLFFDSLTLHASSANNSDRHRRNFIACYNALGNPQIGERKTSQQFPCPVGSADVVTRFRPPVEAAPVVTEKNYENVK